MLRGRAGGVEEGEHERLSQANERSKVKDAEMGEEQVKDDTGEEAAAGHAELLRLDKDVILHPGGNGGPTGL